jgi:hypothetical protein
MSIGLAADKFAYVDFDDFLEQYFEKGWTDGLPVVPPTPTAVAAHISASGLPALHVLGRIPPRWGEATVEKVAVNSVMAGCKPDYMPIIITALSAMLVDEFNLYGVQATTHPCTPAIIVNGPLATQLGINGGVGVFGPGWRQNATIGRAIRLILLNLGGARPGILDQSTQGTPAKYTYCLAENMQESPWESLAVSRGFADSESVVTVAAVEGPHNINDHGSFTGEQILRTIAGTMIAAGSNCMYLSVADSYLFLGPEHAQQIAAMGYTRRTVQEFLCAAAQTPARFIGEGQFNYLRRRHRSNPRYHELGLDRPNLDQIPVLSQPDDVQIVVAGGAGKHSSWAPGSGPVSRSVSQAVAPRARHPEG